MIKTNGDRIGSVGKGQDFYVRGNVKIPENSIIIVPEMQEKKAEQKNVGINIISDDYQDVRDYIQENYLIDRLGYQEETMREYGWDNLASVNEYEKYMKSYGYTKTAPHYATADKDKEVLEYQLNIAKGLRDLLEKEDLDNKEQREKYIDIINNSDIAILRDLMLGDTNFATNNMREFGIEPFMDSLYNEKKLIKLFVENICIDKFLKKQDCSLSIQGETVVESDIQKAVLLNKLINQKGFKYKEQGKECLQILMEHLGNNITLYKKYSQKHGQDWNKKQEELDDMLESLGLDTRIIEEENKTHNNKDAATTMMQRIADNNNLKYIVKLEKLGKLTGIVMNGKLLGIENSQLEEKHTSLLRELSNKIDVPYVDELSKAGLTKQFNHYVSNNNAGLINFSIFCDNFWCDERLLSSEERFEAIRSSIYSEMEEIKRDYYKEYDPEVNCLRQKKMEEKYYKAIQEENLYLTEKEEDTQYSRLCHETAEKPDLYSTNEMGKDTVYADLTIKETIKSEIEKGVTQEQEIQDDIDIGQH